MQNPVIIFGANHIGRQAKEIFERNNVVVYGFLDDNKQLHNTEVDDVMVLGGTDEEEYLKLIGKKCESFVASDDTKLKRSILKMLNQSKKNQPTNAIHQLASVSSRSEMGHGNLIDNNVILSVGSKIGSHNIISAGSQIGVGVTVGNYVQVGVGCHIGNDVSIEDEVFIGAGVTVVSGVQLGKGARVGVGSVVIASVAPNETVFGNPAQKIKP